MNAFHSGRHEISTQSESPAALGTAPPPTDASSYSPGPRSGKCCVRVRVCVSVCVCVCSTERGLGGFRLSQITAAKFCIKTHNLTKYHCSPRTSWLNKENPSIHSSLENCCLHIRTGQSQLLTRAAKDTPPSCL